MDGTTDFVYVSRRQKAVASVRGRDRLAAGGVRNPNGRMFSETILTDAVGDAGTWLDILFFVKSCGAHKGEGVTRFETDGCMRPKVEA